MSAVAEGGATEVSDDYAAKFDAIFDEFETLKKSCAQVFQSASDTRRAYEIAEATALKTAEGTVQEKKAKAELSCVELRQQMDDAEVREKVLKLTFSALESQLSAIQSAAKAQKLEGSLAGYTT